jgi:hypothetical protein
MRKRFMVALAIAALGTGLASASTVIGLSIEDQARLSTLVVAGEVASLAGVDHPQHGIEGVVTLRVTDVLKGNVRPGDTVVFHTRSGQAEEVISEAEGEATFAVGQRRLVFIESIEGRLYNLGLSMGVWSVVQSGNRTVLTRALAGGLEVVGDVDIEYGPISLRDMARRVAWAVTHPEFDNPMLRDARLGR